MLCANQLVVQSCRRWTDCSLRCFGSDIERESHLNPFHPSLAIHSLNSIAKFKLGSTREQWYFASNCLSLPRMTSESAKSRCHRNGHQCWAQASAQNTSNKRWSYLWFRVTTDSCLQFTRISLQFILQAMVLKPITISV